MFVKTTSGRSFDTEFPVERNKNKVISINKTGLLMNHGDSDGTFMFYPWSSIEVVASSIESEKIALGGL